MWLEQHPAGVARAVARALAMKVRLVEEDRAFDPSFCARAGSVRIGEATRPGPRRLRGELRSGLLADVPLVESKTIQVQGRVFAVDA